MREQIEAIAKKMAVDIQAAIREELLAKLGMSPTVVVRLADWKDDKHYASAKVSKILGKAPKKRTRILCQADGCKKFGRGPKYGWRCDNHVEAWKKSKK